MRPRVQTCIRCWNCSSRPKKWSGWRNWCVARRMKLSKTVSHYATEPAAKRLEKGHPDLAARLWRAQGIRIVNAKKSKYYDAALSDFERARDCYQRAGLASEWEQSVRRVCAAHYRKTGFINGFQHWRLVRNVGISPPFWSAPRRVGANGTQEVTYEETEAAGSGFPG